LNEVKDNSIDFVLTHPPYADIISYGEGKISADLSNIHDIEKFAEEMKLVAKELYRVLKPQKYCAILIGDTRRNKMYQPMAYKVMDKFILGVRACINFSQSAKFRVGAEDDVDTGSCPLFRSGLAIGTVEHIGVGRCRLPFRKPFYHQQKGQQAGRGCNGRYACRPHRIHRL